jgi:hypothetical protein
MTWKRSDIKFLYYFVRIGLIHAAITVLNLYNTHPVIYTVLFRHHNTLISEAVLCFFSIVCHSISSFPPRGLIDY